jgi:hypothetical protein
MAVWGRAIVALTIVAALTGCEYTAEGDPRPSAVAGSPSPSFSAPVSAPPESTPDPAWLARIEQMTEEVKTILGPQPPDFIFGMSGPLGPPDAAGQSDPSELPGPVSGSSTAEPGQYTVKVACVGDTEIRFAVHDGDGHTVADKIGQINTPWAPCGKVTSVSRILKSGRVTVEIQGRKRGVEAVGAVQVVKAPAKAAPKP